MKIQHCVWCSGFGTLKGCRICGKKKRNKPVLKSQEDFDDYNRKEIIKEREKNEEKELERMFEKLKKFKMETTGCPQTDQKIRDKFGDWRS